MPEAECYAKANLPVSLCGIMVVRKASCLPLQVELGLLLPQDYYNAIENVLIIRINFIMFS